jgi:TPR repeat protein
VRRNYSEGVFLYRKAADGGLAKSQAALGSLYFEGKGVPQDFFQAAQWSAQQGEPVAQNALGYAYFKGLGLNRDVHQAAEWFQRAAEQGDTQA